MRVLLLIMLLALADGNDHKRPNSLDAKSSETKSAPYNGVPKEYQAK